MLACFSVRSVGARASAMNLVETILAIRRLSRSLDLPHEAQPPGYALWREAQHLLNRAEIQLQDALDLWISAHEARLERRSSGSAVPATRPEAPPPLK